MLLSVSQNNIVYFVNDILESFCLHPENKKDCNHLIFSILVDFYISSSEVSGSPLEHLEVILAIIREVYKEK